MARKTMWAVAGALLAFAPVASALEFDLDFVNVTGDDTSKIYASEVITGTDAEIDYETTEPTVRVAVNFLADESQGISDGDAIELTFTFANAVFADNVRPSAMSFSTGLSDCSLQVSNVDDGDAGDSSVQFTVVADDAACTNSGATFTYFFFELPRLRGLNARAPVTVAVMVDSPGGSGWPTPTDTARTTPSTREVPRSAEPCGTPPTAACVQMEDKTLSRYAPSGDATALLIRYSVGLAFSGTSTGSSTIDFNGGRTAFLRGDPGTLGSVTVGVATAAACTGDDPIPPGCVLQLDGKEFTIDRNGDGQGNLEVTVTGDFREDDSVWLELGERGMQPREMLTMQDDGSMTGMFRLTDVAGDPAGAATGAMGDLRREQGVATRTLHYMPNGEVALRPATFRSSFRVDFADGAVTDKDPTPASSDTNVHETMYPPLVIEDMQHAYAIPGIGTDDIGNVRIKCEVATSCMVYLECDDSAGESWFAELSAPIDGRATHVVRSSDIGEMLGVGEDGWEGMLSCNVLSTRQISVQLLTRAAGVLVNNTYIERE